MSGKLTAEQVRKAIERNFGKVAVIDDGGDKVEWREDWVCNVGLNFQAIADDLNAELVSDTCELKPCPFCGGEAVYQKFNIQIPGRIICACGAEMRQAKFQSMAELVEIWNMRADTEYGAIPATEENMAKHGWVRERTCRFIDDSDGEFPPKCSVCGYDPSIYECSWFGDDGYEFEGNYCPNCGAKVIV